MNENQIADIWMLFKDYIDRKALESAAERYVELLSDHGISDKQLDASIGFDDMLDSAISYYLDGDDAPEFEEEDAEAWDDE